MVTVIRCEHCELRLYRCTVTAVLPSRCSLSTINYIRWLQTFLQFEYTLYNSVHLYLLTMKKLS